MNGGVCVVPYVGTWIEIETTQDIPAHRACRSLRGNVDRNTLADDQGAEKRESFPTWERG